MNIAVNICAVLLVALAGSVTQAEESTLTSCSSENTACTYQHELVCPQPLTVSVQGGIQRFYFGFEFCYVQRYICSNGCCGVPPGCTVAMTSEKISSLSQSCEGRQSCRVNVTRTYVACVRYRMETFYSRKSTVKYRCVQAPSLPSTTETTLAVSCLPESGESTTQSQTPPSDVSEVVATDEREKGDHSSQSGTTSNMAAVWGASAGTVTLVTLSVVLIVCRR